MFVLLNQDVNFKDFVEDGKKGQVIELTEGVGKKVVANQYGVAVKIVKLTPKEVKGPTIAEVKEQLDKAGIEYDSKAKKEDLLKLLPQE